MGLNLRLQTLHVVTLLIGRWSGPADSLAAPVGSITVILRVMGDLRASDQMGVVWIDSGGGAEVSGFSVFALHEPGRERVSLPSFGWPVEPEVASFPAMRGAGWRVSNWDVRVREWPRQQVFAESLGRVLCTLVGSGMSVAWIGCEGTFVDPPFLFLPDPMSGSVLAACSVETGFLIAVDLDEPLRGLSDASMLRLRDASGGLANERTEYGQDSSE